MVSNIYVIRWNYEHAKEATTRISAFVDTGSTGKHQNAKPLEVTMEGMHGSRDTPATIHSTFDALRDRYSGPPMEITVECFDSQNGLEIGDVVWCDFNQRDFNSGGDISRAFEIVGYQATGKKVILNLFGSSQKPGAIAATTAATVLADSFYSTSAGLVSGNKLDTATTGTLTGGVWHITADVTLSGGTDMTDVNNHYWHDVPVTVDAGVTVTLTGNAQLKVMGHITGNGIITTVGQGLAGVATAETAGTTGWAGTTQAGASYDASVPLSVLGTEVGGDSYHWLHERPTAAPVRGANDGAPLLNLINNSTSLDGIATDMRTTSGGGGANLHDADDNDTLAAAGAGGASGGSLIITCRGMSFGASGGLVTDGEAGTVGDSANLFAWNGSFWVRVYAGAGASGSPGVCYVLLDGASATVPDLDNFSAQQPSVPLLGHPSIGNGPVRLSTTQHLIDGQFPKYHRRSGLHGYDLTNSFVRIQYIPPVETAEEDVSEITSPPTGITVQEATATNNTMNQVMLEISVTAPSDGNYRGAMIYIRKNGTSSWQQVGECVGAEEIVWPVPADGSTYNFKAHGVSIFGVESDEYFI
jgi:hypothetical protein